MDKPVEVNFEYTEIEYVEKIKEETEIVENTKIKIEEKKVEVEVVNEKIKFVEKIVEVEQ